MSASLLHAPRQARDVVALPRRDCHVEPAIKRKIWGPYFFTMLSPMPGNASNSASVCGPVATMLRSAWSPKIRNAGMFLCLASLNRQLLKACSTLVWLFASDAPAPVPVCTGWIRDAAFGDVLDFPDFFFRLLEETGFAVLFMTKTKGLVGSKLLPAGVRLTVR